MNLEQLKILHLTTHINTGGVSSYILEAGTEFVRLGHQISVLSSGGELENRMKDKGINVFNFPIRTKNEFHPKLFFYLPDIIRLVKTEKFDLIHAHTRVTQVLASMISLATGVPHVSTAHGFYKRGLGRKVFPSWGKKVVAVSSLVAEELSRTHKISNSKIRIVPNAINITDYRKRLTQKNPSAVRARLGVSDKTFVVGSISRLVRDKGHEYLVEAFAKFLKQNPDSFLLIVGDGRERDRILKLFKKFKLEKKAILIASDPDITGLLSIMDVFVHPATFREGFGLAMLEAMVAKVPVVATNIWAINTIIRDRVNGFLVEPKNEMAIKNALDFILKNQELTGSIVENAYTTAVQNYSIDRLARELETVYREVIS